MNATMRPSGDRAGASAESVKSVSWVYFTPAGRGRRKEYTAAPPIARTAKMPKATRQADTFVPAGRRKESRTGCERIGGSVWRYGWAAGFAAVLVPPRELYARNEPIALFGQRFNINGLRSPVAQSQPDLPDAVVQALVKFDESRITPDAGAQMFARNDLTSPLEQHGQNTQRLGLNLDTAAPHGKASRTGNRIRNRRNAAVRCRRRPFRDPLLAIVYTLMSDEEGFSENSCGL